MSRRRLLMVSLAAVLVAAFTITAPPQTASAATTSRLAGADRYAASVAMSQQFTPGVPVVYVAKGTDFPDSLGAAPAAGAQGGPLLLTTSTALPSNVRAELERLQPQRIVVVGGPASVSEDVLQDLVDIQPETTRIGGADRYEVSRSIVASAFADTPVERLYLATGSTFPDALSSGAAARATGGAVLLVNGARPALDAPTLALIQSIAPRQIVIAGGPASVSTGIEQQVAGLPLANGYQRLAGADRYEASRAINAEAFPSASTVYLATGQNFPDALAGVPLAARDGAPLYVVPGSCVPRTTAAAIRALAPERIVLLGGRASLSDAVGALTECQTAPQVGMRLQCAPNARMMYTITNPNSTTIRVEAQFDTNRDGYPEQTFPIGVGASQTVTVPGAAPAEDSTTRVRLVWNGTVLAQQDVRVDCVRAPQVSTLSFSCSPSPRMTYGISNPNSVGVNVSVRFDVDRNGSIDQTFNIGLAAGQTATITGAAPPEDRITRVSIFWNGTRLAERDVWRDCVQPPPPPTNPTPTQPGNPGNSVNCSDFATQAQAQAWFNRYYPFYGDVALLDSDGDLVACETLP